MLHTGIVIAFQLNFERTDVVTNYNIRENRSRVLILFKVSIVCCYNNILTTLHVLLWWDVYMDIYHQPCFKTVEACMIVPKAMWLYH